MLSLPRTYVCVYLTGRLEIDRPGQARDFSFGGAVGRLPGFGYAFDFDGRIKDRFPVTYIYVFMYVHYIYSTVEKGGKIPHYISKTYCINL